MALETCSVGVAPVRYRQSHTAAGRLVTGGTIHTSMPVVRKLCPETFKRWKRLHRTAFGLGMADGTDRARRPGELLLMAADARGMAALSGKRDPA